MTSVFAPQRKKNYATYTIGLSFTDLVLGGIPSDPHMVKGWLSRAATQAAARADGKARTAVRDEVILNLMRETLDGLGVDISDLSDITNVDDLEKAALERMESSKMQVFKRNDAGYLCIEGRCFKAGLKEAAAVAFPDQWFSKSTGKPSNKNPKEAKGLRSLLAEHVFVRPALISLGVREPSEVITKVNRTPNGSSISIHEAVSRPTTELQVEVYQDRIQKDTWAALLMLLEDLGLNASRSMGFGTFEVTKFAKA